MAVREWEGKRVLVIGSGLSGVGAVKLLCAVGACPVLFDGNEKLAEEEIAGRAGGGYRGRGAAGGGQSWH